MRSSPIQVGTGFYRILASGNNATTVIDPYGTLVAWGENQYGQLGTNNTTLYSWKQLSNGDAHSLAIRNDGILYAWGLNTSGQLGTSDTVARQSPTQINANIGGVVTSTWSAVSAGASHSVAISSDNIAYGWGLNTSGQVGDITIVSRSAPVQIGIAGAPTYYSALFSSSQYLSIADNVALQLSTGQFTIEAWVYSTGALNSDGYIALRGSVSSNGWFLRVLSNTVRIQVGASQYNSGLTVARNSWFHVAFTRDSNNDFRVFVNGVSSGILLNSTYDFSQSTILYIGSAAGASTWNGYISNFRILKGTALYTTNFTPSLSPFSNIANTVLLTCNALTIVDGSSNLFAITNNGSVITSNINPFVYYSGSFDGATNYIQVPVSSTTFEFGTNPFTCEMWVYANGLTGSATPFQYGNYAGQVGGIPSFAVNYSATLNKIIVSLQSNATSGSGSIAGPTWTLSTWYHVAVVGDGTNVTLYVNGTSYGTAGQPNYVGSIGGIRIGAGDSVADNTWAPAYYYNGYVSNVRIVKGVAVYTGNFTTPTNILRTVQSAGTNISALSGTETILLTCQNSTFIDNSTNNFTITNVNNAVVSSTIVPFQASAPAANTGYFVANKVSAGNNYTLAIKSDSTLWSWGTNASGQLGNGPNNNTTISRSSPTQVGTSSYIQISAGASHALAITTDNKLYAWGLNTSGQVSNINTSWIFVNTDALNVGDPVFAIRNDGRLFAWGNNGNGWLGLNDRVNRSSPVQVGTNTYRFISLGGNAGSLVIAAVDNNYNLWTWGQTGGNGWLTLLDTSALSTNRSSPVQIGTSSWTMVSVGSSNVAAIRIDGKLFTAGDKTSLGDGTTVFRTALGLVNAPGVNSWTSVASANQHMVGLQTDYTLWTWGLNSVGQLGLGDTVTRSSPVQIAGSWSAINSAGSTSYAIKIDGTLWGWGTNNVGQLGTGDTANRSSPVQINTGYSYISVSTGYQNFFATDTIGGVWWSGFNWLIDGTTISKSTPTLVSGLTGGNMNNMRVGSSYQHVLSSDNRLYAWGYDQLGHIGVGDTLGRSSPVQLGTTFDPAIVSPVQIGTSSYSLVSAGYSHNAAITSDNRLFTWGNNTNGQLGKTVSYISIDSGNEMAAAVRDDGTLWAWGLNTYGQLGINDVITRSSPVQVGTAINYVVVNTDNTNTFAINSLNQLFGWGRNDFGSIGDGTTNFRSTPTQISGSFTLVSTGGDVNNTFGLGTQATYAINSVGALFAWGSNHIGQLGNSNLSAGQHSSSPIQIGSSSWSLVAAGANFALAITTDSRLFAWGNNNNGQLGVTPSTFSWSKVSTGTLHTLAIRSDNKLFAWGDNTGGKLGVNDTTNRSSPVLVSTGSWSQISAGLSNSYAITSDGKLYTWGDNTVGQLGDPTAAITGRSSPVQLGTSSWSQISSSVNNNFVLALSSNNTLYSWGINSGYQLGIGDALNRSSPVLVSGGLSWNSVSAGQSHVLAISNTNKLYVWGAAPAGSEFGQLGTVIPFSWSKITTGGQHTLALHSDGKLYAWGLNTAGQLGLTDTVNRSSPVLVASGSWSQISAGLSSSYAIRGDGALFTWGDNTNGQLGDPAASVTGRSSPVQVGTSSWTKVSASATVNYVIATRDTSLLYGWGQNSTNYQLGLNDTIDRSSPVQIGSSSFTQISVGGGHTLAIDINNKLYGWGLNNAGQAPNIVSWTQVAMGQGFGIALKANGTLWGWGLNTSVQLGQGDTVYRSSPVQIGAGLGSWTKISAGGGQSFAIRTDGTLWGWGAGTSGKLGTGDTLNRSSPVQIGTDTWNFIFAGPVNSTWGINSLGKLYAWGVGGSGILGLGDQVARSTPVQITTVTSSWVVVASGGTAAFTGAITTDGKLFTWGNNTSGQLGLGDTIFRSNPVQIVGNSWTTVAVGLSVMGGIDTTGRLFTWGANVEGEFGDGSGTATNRSAPVQVGSSSWSFLAAGGTVAAAGAFFGVAGGALYGWGDSQYGQLATTVGRLSTQTAIPGPASFTQVSTNGSTIVGISTDNKLYTWGYGGFGQLGINATTNRSSPVQVGPAGDNVTFSPVLIGNSSWTSIGAGRYASMAIRSDSTLWSWGQNTVGQLGDISTIDRPSPVQVGASTWSSVSAGDGYAIAITSDGKLYSWGNNTQGQLGSAVATTIVRSSPVQVGTSSWSIVSAGGTVSLGIDINNNLYAWGLNTSGQVGDNTTANRSAPTQITPNYERYFISPINLGTSSWSVVSAGYDHSAAIRSDGGLFTWGNNTSGQLGLTNINATGDTVNRSSPVQVGTSSWSSVGTGNRYTLGLRYLDGALFTWGFGTQGQLGSGAVTPRSSPVQVGTSSYTQISAGNSTAAIIDTGKNLYTWGYGAGGQLGDGTTISKLTPTKIGTFTSTIEYSPLQVGTSSWASVSAGYDHSIGILINNTVYTWGNNNNGQLGDVSQISRSSPVQIGTVTNTLTNINAYSSYFDGSSYVTAPYASNDLFGSGTVDFTIEFYVATTDTSWEIFAPRTSGLALFISGGAFYFQDRYGQVTGQQSLSVAITSTILDGSWHHIAVVRNATTGNTNIYFDGVSKLSFSNYSTTFATGSNYDIGYGVQSAGRYLTGYISNFRVVAGTAVYSSNFTPPTSPLTAISGTTLLTFQNTTLIDNSTFTRTLTVTGTVTSGNVNTPYPSAVGTGAIFATQISAGYQYSSAIANNKLYTWGWNQYGQLGAGDTSPKSSPFQVGVLTQWKNITSGTYGNFGITNDNTLYIWGFNTYGELGQNDIVSRSNPVQLSAFSLYNLSSPTQVGTNSWSSISTGNNTTVGLSSTNKLFVWGLGTTGQIGTSITLSRSSPVQISTSSYSLISAGGTHTTFVLNSSPQILLGTGLNTSGQLGDVSTVNRNSPVQVTASLTKFNSPVTVSVGNYSSYYVNSPTQVGTSSWSQVSTGGTHTLGIKKDNKLYAWGLNNYGQLGGSNTINNSSPVQIGNSSWSQVSAGDSHNIIAKSDGTINTFGLNNFGQLGDGT